MVTIHDGRYQIPDNLLYSKNQHVYLDKSNKIIGLDEIGYAFLQNPNEIQFLSENEVQKGTPFVAITTDSGITTLNSPCSGKIKITNKKALEGMKNNTYTIGFLVELEDLTDIEAELITGDEVEQWAINDAKSLIRNNYSFKILEIGDSAVGKTAIKVRFTDNYYKKDLKTTLGVDFGSKEIKGEYKKLSDPITDIARFTAKMNIWDTAGQSMYDKIRGMYYKDAKGAILCYDVSNPISFDNLDKWRSELEENLGKVPTLLVGNKIDLERKVDTNKGLEYAKKHGYLFIECSAKTGEGIEDIFTKLAIEIFKKEENLE